MEARSGLDRYLLEVANELGQSVLPHVGDSNAAFMLQACCRVLVGLAFETALSVDPREGIPREVPPLAGAVRVRADAALAASADWTAADRAQLAAEEGALMDGYIDYVARQLDGMFTAREDEQGDIDIVGLEAWLQERDAASALKIVGFRIATAGYSKRTIVVDIEGANRLPACIVIRADPPNSTMPTSVLSEYALLGCLYDRGIAVPKPLHMGSAQGPLHAPFMLVEGVAGGLDGHLLRPPARKETALDLARQLGRLHAITASDVDHIALPMPPSGAWPDAVEQLRAEWRDGQHAPSLSVTLALDWLAAAAPKIQSMNRLIHGDVGFHNILVDGGRISAILDWELARTGHPGEDLGYVRPVVEQRVSWDEFMAVYREAGGPDQDDLSVTFFVLFTFVRLLLLMFSTRSGFESGAVNGVKAADATIHYMVGVVHLISRELRSAMRRHGPLP
jgi:aminoglycoside phosphotransferase (APT) family kinase protein